MELLFLAIFVLVLSYLMLSGMVRVLLWLFKLTEPNPTADDAQEREERSERFRRFQWEQRNTGKSFWKWKGTDKNPW